MLAFQNSNYLVNTEEFDGPLELLLYLVKKSSVDVKEIEIAPITDAYLQHIKNIELLNSLCTWMPEKSAHLLAALLASGVLINLIFNEGNKPVG